MRKILTLTLAAALLAGCATRPGRLVVPGYHRVGTYTLHERATTIPFPHCATGEGMLLGISYGSERHPPQSPVLTLAHAWRVTNAPGANAHVYCVRGKGGAGG